MPAYIVELRPSEHVVADASKAMVIVIADRPAQVQSHIFNSMYVLRPLGTEEAIELVQAGVQVENGRKATELEEAYTHKTGCPADTRTPIGQGNCRCTQLPLG